MCIYIYIYREREREIEKNPEGMNLLEEKSTLKRLVLMSLHLVFKMVKQAVGVLIEYINRGKKYIYTKKDHIIVQSFNQRSFSKINHLTDTGNDVKQMESLRRRRRSVPYP